MRIVNISVAIFLELSALLKIRREIKIKIEKTKRGMNKINKKLTNNSNSNIQSISTLIQANLTGIPYLIKRANISSMSGNLNTLIWRSNALRRNSLDRFLFPYKLT